MSTTYDIFARKEHPEPLMHIGSVEAETADDISQVSLKQFGPESDWLEMVAVPHRNVIVVFPEKEETE